MNIIGLTEDMEYILETLAIALADTPKWRLLKRKQLSGGIAATAICLELTRYRLGITEIGRKENKPDGGSQTDRQGN